MKSIFTPLKAGIVLMWSFASFTLFAQHHKQNVDSIAMRDSVRDFLYQGTLFSMNALQSKYESERATSIEVKHQKSVEAQNLFYQARISYRKVIKLDSNNYTAWSNIGTTYLLEGLPKEAKYCFRQAVQINPGYSPAWFNLGKVYSEGSGNDSAELAFSMAIRNDSGYTQAYQEWSNLIMKSKKDTARALSLLRISAVHTPQSEVPWVNMSEIFFQSGDSVSGLHALEHAAAIYPGDVDRLKLLVDYYGRHNDEKKKNYYSAILAVELKKLEVPKDEHPEQ
ncbi:MAG TPA: tetratricopeptide repeat protein [Bacteroidia bacterium]|jgi:Tfp pilus assembly protein PilF|nr:tetratricopeptide repeat protein [Bacteroidia bacterium]